MLNAALSDDASWIAGLMKQNYPCVGFIPDTTVQRQYLAQGRYVLQYDEQGRRVGYLLHGSLRSGNLLAVAQHCIDLDKRLHGYGEKAFCELVERARVANCRAIKLHCASDLASNLFWQAMGLELVSVRRQVNTRNRSVNVYVYDLWPSLWSCGNETVALHTTVQVTRGVQNTGDDCFLAPVENGGAR